MQQIALALKAPPAYQAHKRHLAPKAHRVKLARKENQVNKVQSVRWVLLGHKVNQDHKGSLGQPVQWVLPGLTVNKVQLARWVPLGPKVLPALRDCSM